VFVIAAGCRTVIVMPIRPSKSATAADPGPSTSISLTSVAIGSLKSLSYLTPEVVEPTDYGDAEPDGVSDYVSLLVENIAEGMVERMAAE
jgi:hypothetical protein